MYRDVARQPRTTSSCPTVIVVRLDGGLFFATSDALEDRVRTLIQAQPDVHGVVLDSRASTSSTRRARPPSTTSSCSATRPALALRLARVKPDVRAVLERDGILERLGRGPHPRQRPPCRRGAAPTVVRVDRAGWQPEDPSRGGCAATRKILAVPTCTKRSRWILLLRLAAPPSPRSR